MPTEPPTSGRSDAAHHNPEDTEHSPYSGAEEAFHGPGQLTGLLQMNHVTALLDT